MTCTVTGRHMEVSGALHDMIHERLLPLERLLGDAVVSANMVLAAERHLCVSELVVHARGDRRLHGLAEGRNWQIAVGAAVEKVMHQAQTLKGKWQERRRHAVPPSDLAGGTGDGDAPD